MDEKSPCQPYSATPQRGGTSTAWSRANSKVFLVLEGGLHTWKKEMTFGIPQLLLLSFVAYMGDI